MHKLWLVAKHEYLKRVRKRTFLLAVLGFPLLMVVIGVISALVAIRGGDARPVGFVDQAAILDSGALSTLQEERKRFPDFVAFTDPAAGHASLMAGEIQSYYVIPDDYLTGKTLTVFYGDGEPSEMVVEGFADFVRASLVARQPVHTQERLSEGFDLVVRSDDDRRKMRESNVLDFVIPFVAALLMFFAIASVSGYMLAAVTEEKENRTMEILTTSVSPLQLMGGKAVGLMCVSLTQILVWVITLIVGSVVAARLYPQLQGTAIPWEMLVLAVVFFLPTFALVSGAMVSIGAMVIEQQQGQQISGILNQLFVFPIYFAALFITNPNSPFLVVLTLFPTTALTTVLLRWATGSVPMWQLAVSWVILVCTTGATVWLSGRILRIGMLRYGQRLRLKAVVAALRGHHPLLEQEATSNA